MKRKIAIAASVAVLIIVIVIMYQYQMTHNNSGFLLSGNVEVTEVNVGFKIPGRVRTLFTDEGRTVNFGDKIADLDSEEFESIVNQSKASVRSAEIQLKKASNDFDRYTKLYKDGVISPQQMDSAKTVLDDATSQLQMYNASLKTAKVKLGDSVIYSPLNGVVLRKNIEQGETVSAGTPVFTIGDLANPWVKVYVKEDKLGLVKLGQKAEIIVDSFPNRRYEGTVTYISSDAEFTPKNIETKEERVKLVFGVKITVKNQLNELKPGMPADVRIMLK
jgi:HlyD family secretion protein